MLVTVRVSVARYHCWRSLVVPFRCLATTPRVPPTRGVGAASRPPGAARLRRRRARLPGTLAMPTRPGR